MNADPYTFINVPAGTLTRLEISDTTARAIVAEYGGDGWRVCQIGKVVVLHSCEKEDWIDRPQGRPTGSPDLEHAAANLLHAWQNGVPLTEQMLSSLSDALQAYRSEAKPQNSATWRVYKDYVSRDHYEDVLKMFEHRFESEIAAATRPPLANWLDDIREYLEDSDNHRQRGAEL